MNVICFDSISGASGNMVLGSLFDLGADAEEVERRLKTAAFGDFSLHYKTCYTSGIRCGYCEVHENHHEHAGHQHDHHRGLDDILCLLNGVEMSQTAYRRAEQVFRRLAEAEAQVHNVDMQEVHFHEVGAIDTIVDVAGTCIALDILEVDKVYTSDFKIGHGTIHCAHGTLPVPAPATTELLQGHTITRLDIATELTTPTGAALLTTLSEGEWFHLPGRFLRSGIGHGTKEFDNWPNILRAYLLQTQPQREPAEVLETDIDDENPEILASLADQLLKQGALDVTRLAVQMKKGRLGTRFQVMCHPALSAQLIDTVFRESSTLGIRITPVTRRTLQRSSTEVETPWGTVPAKRIDRPHGVEITPEADAAISLAEQHNVPVRDIMKAARRAVGNAENWQPPDKNID